MIKAFKNTVTRDIYLNISHFIDHFVMLVFAKAAYDSSRYFAVSYDKFIIYGTLGFVLFGAMAPVAAILSDKYSRSFMMVVFHIGVGLSAVTAGLSKTPLQLSVALGLLGLFASIYHPVGIAMLIEKNKKIGFRLGVNGVFGNMGVATAPLITGLILVLANWRYCFIIPGVACLFYGFVFLKSLQLNHEPTNREKKQSSNTFAPNWLRVLIALSIATLSGGFIFGAATFFIPRYFEVSMTNLSSSVALTGMLASIVYATASFSQIGVGWLIDRYSPKLILLLMGLGQVVFIFLASQYTDMNLLIVSIFAMAFVFGQIPITDTIISRYVPDIWRSRILSIKFLLNLSVGALVLPISSFLLQYGYKLSDLFLFMSSLAILVSVSAMILPSQAPSDRLDQRVN